jgi:hypothetical protein
MKCKLPLYLSLIAHALPTVLIGYGLVIPRSRIAGLNELTIGFGASVVGTCIAYVVGLEAALRRQGKATCAAS